MNQRTVGYPSTSWASCLITWRSSSSKSVAMCTISWTWSSWIMIFRWDMAIYRFSKWRPSAILELFTTIRDHPRSLCCWPQLPVKFHLNVIHRSEDIAIWIFRIFGLKCLLAWNTYSGSPNGGFGELWTTKCDYSSSRPPKGTSLRKSASVKLSTVKSVEGSDL